MFKRREKVGVADRWTAGAEWQGVHPFGFASSAATGAAEKGIESIRGGGFFFGIKICAISAGVGLCLRYYLR